MTYNELLTDAIKYDEERLAYSIYWLIKQGIIKGTDFAKQINWDLVNHDEVTEMITRNELGMVPIKLFSMPIGEGKHLLVFAQDEKSARGHCLNELGIVVQKIFDLTDKINRSFWFPEKQKYLSLRELRDETLVFPATALIFEK